MSKKPILIASSMLDSVNFERVANILIKRGFEVVVYEPDSVARGARKIQVHLAPSGKLSIHYDGKAFVPEDFGAAWYRRPSFYGPIKDKHRWSELQPTYQALERTLWQLIPASVWLNDPRNMAYCGEKLTQFVAAAQVGFTICETVMSNTWEPIEAMSSDKLVVKLSNQVSIQTKEGEKIFPTATVRKNKLPKQVSPYPGMWQPYVEKKREWRVTVVGNKVFPAAIYTDKDAKDDWRIHTFSSRVTFKAEPFPEDLGQKCVALLERLNLRYGAFDFIETPEGEMIFLEVNTNGQFMWLEHDLGLPISEAIADELAAIAEANT